MSTEGHETSPLQGQHMQRLNRFATLAGAAAVLFFGLTWVVAVFSPPLPPASAPPVSPTPTLTLTPTPTLTPTLTPSPGATPPPPIELIGVEYLQPGAGCQVDVTVKVNGEALTGFFHVWNASYKNDSAGSVFEVKSLPPGLSSGYLLRLNGSKPEFYLHEIWFVYDGAVSNRLTGLICPELTPAP